MAVQLCQQCNCFGILNGIGVADRIGIVGANSGGAAKVRYALAIREIVLSDCNAYIAANVNAIGTSTMLGLQVLLQT